MLCVYYAAMTIGKGARLISRKSERGTPSAAAMLYTFLTSRDLKKYSS